MATNTEMTLFFCAIFYLSMCVLLRLKTFVLVVFFVNYTYCTTVKIEQLGVG